MACNFRLQFLPSAKRLVTTLTHDRAGTNAVEFALVAPVLLLLVFGVFYVGLYLGVSHSLAQIAADTSRYALAGENAAERQQLAERWYTLSGGGYPLVDPRRMAVAVVEANDLLRVEISYDISYLPVPGLVRTAAQLPATIVQTSSVAVP